MRIAIITKNMEQMGGIERFVQTTTNYWAKVKNHDIVIITSNGIGSSYKLNHSISIIKIDGQSSSNAFLSKFPSLNYHFCYTQDYISKLQAFFSTWKPDVIISQMQGQDNLLLSKVPITNKVPVIGVSHITCRLRFLGFNFYQSCSLPQKLKRAITNKKIISNIHKYDIIVSISREDMFILRHQYKCKSIYLPNPNTFDKCYIANPNNKKVIMIGRFDYLKGQDRLLKIWAYIAHKHLDWSLTLVGEGYTRNKMILLAQDLGISQQVEFVPNCNNVQRKMLEASICAFTSREESFGLAITEALQCGLPTVVFDCNCGPKDIITSYYNGFLIDDGNEHEFANKLELLMSNAALRAELSKNAIMSVQRFNKRTIMRQWDDLLIQVINKKTDTSVRSVKHRDLKAPV